MLTVPPEALAVMLEQSATVRKYLAECEELRARVELLLAERTAELAEQRKRGRKTRRSRARKR